MASSIKRARRSKQEMDAIREALYLALEKDNPMTVRQVFYRLVSQGKIDKTETEYDATVGRLLASMRRAGDIPFGWIADNTRWMRKPRTFDSLENALHQTAHFYRRNLWNEQAAYVEIWLEKDALAGVLYDVTEEWDVPLMVTRGYPSLTYLHEAGETIASSGKPTFIYYLGDHDPSGVDIPRKVEAGLREFAPEADIHFERIAVNPDQILQWKLPTRPTKSADTRSKGFIGESVEVDAIPPDDLRSFARKAIMQHVDMAQLEVLQIAERSERSILMNMVNGNAF